MTLWRTFKRLTRFSTPIVSTSRLRRLISLKSDFPPPHRAAPAASHRPALPCSTRLRVGRPTKALARSCIIIIAASQKHILLIARACGEAPLPLGAPAHNGPVYTCHAPAVSFKKQCLSLNLKREIGMLRCSARFYKNRADVENTARFQDLARLTFEEPSSPVPECVL